MSQPNKFTLPIPTHAGEITIAHLKDNPKWTKYFRQSIENGRPFKKFLYDPSRANNAQDGKFPAIDWDNPSNTNTFKIHPQDCLKPDVFKYLKYGKESNTTHSYKATNHHKDKQNDDDDTLSPESINKETVQDAMNKHKAAQEQLDQADADLQDAQKAFDSAEKALKEAKERKETFQAKAKIAKNLETKIYNAYCHKNKEEVLRMSEKDKDHSFLEKLLPIGSPRTSPTPSWADEA